MSSSSLSVWTLSKRKNSRRCQERGGGVLGHLYEGTDMDEGRELNSEAKRNPSNRRKTSRSRAQSRGLSPTRRNAKTSNHSHFGSADRASGPRTDVCRKKPSIYLESDGNEAVHKSQHDYRQTEARKKCRKINGSCLMDLSSDSEVSQQIPPDRQAQCAETDYSDSSHNNGDCKQTKEQHPQGVVDYFLRVSTALAGTSPQGAGLSDEEDEEERVPASLLKTDENKNKYSSADQKQDSIVRAAHKDTSKPSRKRIHSITINTEERILSRQRTFVQSEEELSKVHDKSLKRSGLANCIEIHDEIDTTMQTDGSSGTVKVVDLQHTGRRESQIKTAQHEVPKGSPKGSLAFKVTKIPPTHRNQKDQSTGTATARGNNNKRRFPDTLSRNRRCGQEEAGNNLSRECIKKHQRAKCQKSRDLGTPTAIDENQSLEANDIGWTNDYIMMEGKTFHLVRCTVGFHEGKSDCVLKYNMGRFELSYKARSRLLVQSLVQFRTFISPDDIVEFKNFSGHSLNDSLFLAVLRVEPSGLNCLASMHRFYAQSNDDNSQDGRKKYINLEFRNRHDFDSFMYIFQRCSDCCKALLKESLIDYAELDYYAGVILKTIAKEKTERVGNMAVPTLQHGQSKRRNNGDEILLVFPFAGDQQRIDAACEGLHEPADCHEISQGAGAGTGDENESLAETYPASAKPRIHFLTIRKVDRARLASPREYLNDSLIDFWMQWMVRKEAHGSSRVHIFSTHFFSTLRDEGVKAVESWTAKKKINVFTKKLIFVPINKSLHWSLCVIVNPGMVIRVHKQYETIRDARSADDLPAKLADMEAPCILFLDSLKAHQKKEVANRVRTWLKGEWIRLNPGMSDSVPQFDGYSIPFFAPEIPWQHNGYDCGLFVCRYAYALFKRRHVTITFRNTKDRSGDLPMLSVTNAQEFQFNSETIVRLRKEMGVLIDNLSAYYVEWKEMQGGGGNREGIFPRLPIEVAEVANSENPNEHNQSHI